MQDDRLTLSAPSIGVVRAVWVSLVFQHLTTLKHLQFRAAALRAGHVGGRRGNPLHSEGAHTPRPSLPRGGLVHARRSTQAICLVPATPEHPVQDLLPDTPPTYPGAAYPVGSDRRDRQPSPSPPG